MWGRLYSTHAELAERKLNAMARRVCAEDPRTTGQLRAEEMGAVFAGADRIACQCGRADCPNSNDDSLAEWVVIGMVAADQAAVTSITAETKSPPQPQKPAQTRGPAAVMAVGGVVPNPLLARFDPQRRESGPATHTVRGDRSPLPGVCGTAEVRPAVGICPVAFPAATIRPNSVIWTIRCRMSRAARRTRPTSNVCRKHHLLKTFWAGSDGWATSSCPTAPSSGRHRRVTPTPRIQEAASTFPTGMSPWPGCHPRRPVRRNPRTAA